MINIKLSRKLAILIFSLLIALLIWWKIRYDEILENKKMQIRNCQNESINCKNALSSALENSCLDSLGVMIKDKNGFNIIVDSHDDIVSRLLIKEKVWEDHLQNALKQLIKPNDRVLILGAHIGYHAILIGKLI